MLNVLIREKGEGQTDITFDEVMMTQGKMYRPSVSKETGRGRGYKRDGLC